LRGRWVVWFVVKLMVRGGGFNINLALRKGGYYLVLGHVSPISQLPTTTSR